jgi:hypothetical protein
MCLIEDRGSLRGSVNGTVRRTYWETHDRLESLAVGDFELGVRGVGKDWVGVLEDASNAAIKDL